MCGALVTWCQDASHVTDTDIEFFHNALKFVCGRQMSKINEVLSEKSSEVTQINR